MCERVCWSWWLELDMRWWNQWLGLRKPNNEKKSLNEIGHHKFICHHTSRELQFQCDDKIAYSLIYSILETHMCFVHGSRFMCCYFLCSRLPQRSRRRTSTHDMRISIGPVQCHHSFLFHFYFRNLCIAFLGTRLRSDATAFKFSLSFSIFGFAAKAFASLFSVAHGLPSADTKFSIWISIVGWPNIPMQRFKSTNTMCHLIVQCEHPTDPSYHASHVHECSI